MARHLIDVDEEALESARREFGTTTVTDTVNEALRRSAQERARKVREALDELAKIEWADREEMWR